MSSSHHHSEEIFDNNKNRLIRERKEKNKNWTEADWTRLQVEYDEVSKALAKMINAGLSPEDQQVQAQVAKHLAIIQLTCTPTKSDYIDMGKMYCENTHMRELHAKYHAKLPEFLAKTMKLFANRTMQ